MPDETASPTIAHHDSYKGWRYPGFALSPEADRLLGSKLLIRPQALIRADRVAYILFEIPDLRLQERFLHDFGMSTVAVSESELFLRGAGPEPYIYAASRGSKAAYLGVGFAVNDRAALQVICAAVPGTKIEPVSGPGGGERVRLRDPGGFIVDVVHGRTPAPILEGTTSAVAYNGPRSRARINRPVRPPLAPSDVQRLGHVVLGTEDFDSSAQWYMRHLGLIPTDVQCLEDGTPALAFMRLDRGEQPADHHSLVVARVFEHKYLHSAYEVSDLDSLGQGQNVLRAGGWRHFWGLGRHALGSQLFDYWLDPYGHEVEHYADGDLFDASHPTGYHPLDLGGLWMWGDDLPLKMRRGPSFLEKISAIAKVAKGRIKMAQLKMTARAFDRPARPWLG